MVHCSSQQNYIFSVFTLQQNSFVLYRGWQFPRFSTIFVIISIKSNHCLHKLRKQAQKGKHLHPLIKSHCYLIKMWGSTFAFFKKNNRALDGFRYSYGTNSSDESKYNACSGLSQALPMQLRLALTQSSHASLLSAGIRSTRTTLSWEAFF